jgi:hypothetical protein
MYVMVMVGQHPHGSQPVGMFAYDHKTHETSNVQKTSMMMTM